MVQINFLSSKLRQKNNILTTVRIMDFEKLNLVKLHYSGLVLSLSQFLPLPLLPQKMMLDSNVVKSDSKIIISLC